MRDLDCTVETFGTPSSEPMCWWSRCSCGHWTPACRSRIEARTELDRLHARKVVAA